MKIMRCNRNAGAAQPPKSPTVRKSQSLQDQQFEERYALLNVSFKPTRGRVLLRTRRRRPRAGVKALKLRSLVLAAGRIRRIEIFPLQIADSTIDRTRTAWLLTWRDLLLARAGRK